MYESNRRVAPHNAYGILVGICNVTKYSQGTVTVQVALAQGQASNNMKSRLYGTVVTYNLRQQSRTRLSEKQQSY